jgi:hypothetical protein
MSVIAINSCQTQAVKSKMACEKKYHEASKKMARKYLIMVGEYEKYKETLDDLTGDAIDYFYQLPDFAGNSAGASKKSRLSKN